MLNAHQKQDKKRLYQFLLILFEDVQQNLYSFQSVFSIIADEVIGKYDNKEISSVCVRFIKGENISGVFLDFVE